MILRNILAAGVISMTAVSAHAATLTFEGFATNTAINSFGTADGNGTVTTISNRVGGTNQAVVFDSVNPTGNDTDLKAPFTHTGGTLADLDPGKLLIIAGPDNGQGLPDDDREGGTITFKFDRLVNLLGFNYFDTEENGNQLVMETDTGFMSGDLIAGDGKFGVFDTQVSGVREVTFRFGGSGAIDDLSFVAAVPLPAAAWMLLAGLGGLAAMGRRKTTKAS